MRFSGQYPDQWAEIALAVKQQANWTCERCSRQHNPAAKGHVLTVHHLDNNKGNIHWWNLVALCQKCHLQVQGKVVMDRPWFLPHTEWFTPYVAAFYAHKYLGLTLTREEVMADLDNYLALEIEFLQGENNPAGQALAGPEPVKE